MPNLNGFDYPDTPAGIARSDGEFRTLFNNYWPTQKTGFDNAFLSQVSKARKAMAFDVLSLTGLDEGSARCQCPLPTSARSRA